MPGQPLPVTPLRSPPRPFIQPPPAQDFLDYFDPKKQKPKPKPPNEWFHDLALGGWPKLTKTPSTVDDAWLFYGIATKRASREAIEALWKARARAWHPDRHRETQAVATLHFKRNNAAWQILQTYCHW
jgi:hypothetical protein